MSDKNKTSRKLPQGQQWVAEGKWPVIGEKSPAFSDLPWSISIGGAVENELTYSVEQLRNEFPQTKVVLDIHCVTRWSMPDVEIEGVALKEIVTRANPGPDAGFVNFIARSERTHSSSMELETALGLNTLIALKMNGEPVPEGHGGPIRNIVPDRYFYKSVKWLTRIEFLKVDAPGFWEAESGYHNLADPWQEQRYMAPTVDRRTAAKLIESRDFSDQDLRSIRLSGMKLDNLIARKSLIRDGQFDNASLSNANFTNANMSNANFHSANLRGAKFVNADLEGANFAGADLRQADFTGSFLTAVTFCDFDDNGRICNAAQFDENTKLDESLLAPLTPEQLAFVVSQLRKSTD